MYWIYIPPIILVASLAALVVILGRKSADLKRIRPFGSKFDTPEAQTGSNWKNKLRSIGRKTLHFLEKFLIASRTFFKKTELVVSGWAMKLRARRNGKKMEETPPEDIPQAPESEEEARIIREIEKTEDISSNLEFRKDRIAGAGSDVIIRKKVAEEPAKLPKKEPLPEDKVKEAALIYRIAENPKDIEAYREIGDYYMGIGNIKDAKESFKMVLKLRPRDLKAKSSLREIEMKMRLGN